MLPVISTALLLSSYGLVEAFPLDDTKPPTYNALDWAPCDLDFPESLEADITAPIDCATLGVPLDYTNPDSETLDLQLVKVKATKEPFKGSVIFNPGGPGNSGVEEVATMGPVYRDVFGGQFDVIGFDARGTGRTIPYICDLTKGTSNSNSLSRRVNSTTLPQADLWSILQSKAWDDGRILADACYESQKETGRFVGTAFVARDMLGIVDALDEDGLLRFWGRSYSTTLGQTFAAMFPDRIDRMLLDSVQLASDYHSGRWLTAAAGCNDALMNFFTECVDVGPSVCPLANYTGPSTSPQDLMAGLAEVFQELLDDPIVLPEDHPTLPWWQPGGMLLHTELKYVILTQLYRPDQFPTVVALMTETLARNWTSWLNPAPIDPPGTNPEIAWNLGVNAFHGIGCGDGSNRVDSPDDMYSLLQALPANNDFADGFAPQTWPCAQWRLDAAEKIDSNFRDINTSYPIMFVNSPYDPITPLASAWEASAGFKGSRLLVHKGHGHGLMNHPSECTIKAIGEYFANGTLPEHGTVCETDMTGFEYAAANPLEIA